MLYQLSYQAISSHLHSSLSTGILRTHNVPKLPVGLIGLDSSVGRALHWYRRGHGFKSRSGLNFSVQALISKVARVRHKLGKIDIQGKFQKNSSIFLLISEEST